MTVSAQTTRTTQNCNGSLTEFNFNFAIYKEEDLAIIIRDTDQEETLLVLNTDYTVSSDDFADGGIVKTIKEIDEELVPYAYPSGYTITIMLNLALTQETDLIYGGAFSSEAIETCSDKLTRIAQQLDERLGRAIKLHKSSTQSDLEIDDLEAGKTVVVNTEGDGLEMGTASGGGGASVSNLPYDKDSWNSIVDIAASKNAIRDELVDNRFTKGGTLSMILALSSGEFTALPISNTVYGASWDGKVDTAASKNALYDKIETMGSGGMDELKDDTTPQLGGNLDMNGKTIGGNTEEQLDDAVAKKHHLSDIAYGASWNGVTDQGASKNAIFDVLDSMGVNDHGALSGLGDDDHAQYHTKNRMDIAVALASDLTANGPTTNELDAGEAVTAGQCVMIESDGEWHPTDADAEANSDGMLGISLESKTDGQAMNVALAGSFVRNDGWSWTKGSEIYLSCTTGALTHTAPSGSGDIVRIVGYATSIHTMYFVPDQTFTEVGGGGGGYTNLTQFVDQTAWRIFHSDGSGDTTELALGTSGQFLKSTGATSAPVWDTPSGAGDVVGPASAVDTALTLFDGTTGKLIKESPTTVDAAGAPTFPNNIALRWKQVGGAVKNVLAYDVLDNIIIGVDGDDASVFIERLDTSSSGAPLQSGRKFKLAANYWKAAAEHQRMGMIWHEMVNDNPTSRLHFEVGEEDAEAKIMSLENNNGTLLATFPGNVKIEGGTPSAGYVLTSDANGLATWEAAGGGGSSKWTDGGTYIYGTTEGGNTRLHDSGQLEIGATGGTGSPLITSNKWGFSSDVTENARRLLVLDGTEDHTSTPAIWLEKLYNSNGTPTGDPTIPVTLYAAHKHTGSGTGFTHTVMAYALNEGTGNNDVVAVSGRARKTGNGVGDACGVWGSAYNDISQDGGVMALEASIYQNVYGMAASDRLLNKWSCGLHINSVSTGSNASAGIAIDGANTYRFWNAILIDKESFAGAGMTGTVGINCGSWDTGNHPQYGIKMGKAGTHIYCDDGDLTFGDTVTGTKTLAQLASGGGGGLWNDAGTYYNPTNWSDFKIYDSGKLDMAGSKWVYDDVTINMMPIGQCETHAYNQLIKNHALNGSEHETTAIFEAKTSGSNSKNKVALMTAAQATGGNNQLWALNPLITVDSAWNPGPDGYAITCEIDMNCNSANGKCQGLSIVGASTHDPHIALGIGMSGAQWEYGILLSAIKDFGIHFDATAPTYGIKFDGVCATADIAHANNGKATYGTAWIKGSGNNLTFYDVTTGEKTLSQLGSGSGLWADEGTYYRPGNVTNSGNTGCRIYDAGYTQLGQVSPTTGTSFGGGSTDGTILKLNHGNSGTSTNDANSPLWVKRYYNYAGSAWNAGAAYFGAVKTAGEGSLHTVQIDTHCQGGTVPTAGGVLGNLLSHLKNDTCTNSGEDIHNLQVITYTPSSNYSSVHATIMCDLNNRYGSKGWLDDYAAGWTCGIRVANESTSAYDNSCAYSMGSGSGGGKWYTGYQINALAYDGATGKGEGIYFKTGTFDTNAMCMRAEGKLTACAGNDIELYAGTSNWTYFKTGTPASSTTRAWITNAGNFTTTGTLTTNGGLGNNLFCNNYEIVFNNNKALLFKNTSSSNRVGLRLNSSNDWEAAMDANRCYLGHGCSNSNPIHIRVGGVNSKQVLVGAANSGGSGYRMLRVTN